MRLIILFLFFFFVVFLPSCTKQTIVTPIAFQKQLLSGTGSFQSTSKRWDLDSMTINGKDTTLTKLQRLYFEKYETNGKYSDYDFKTGTWDITIIDKLKNSYKIYSFLKPDSVIKIDTITFDILTINSSKLKLRKNITSNGLSYKIDYSFHLAY